MRLSNERSSMRASITEHLKYRMNYWIMQLQSFRGSVSGLPLLWTVNTDTLCPTVISGFQPRRSFDTSTTDRPTLGGLQVWTVLHMNCGSKASVLRQQLATVSVFAGVPSALFFWVDILAYGSIFCKGAHDLKENL